MTYISFFAFFQTIIVWWTIWSAYHIGHTLAWFHAGPVMDCGWYFCYGWCSYCCLCCGWCSCCLCCGWFSCCLCCGCCCLWIKTLLIIRVFWTKSNITICCQYTWIEYTILWQTLNKSTSRGIGTYHLHTDTSNRAIKI